MKTFRIKIGRNNKKGFEMLNEIFVNSENILSDVKNAYINKYAGFAVLVEEIQTIEVFSKEEDKKDAQPVVSKVTHSEASYDRAESYYASIEHKDIPDFKDFEIKIKEANKVIDSTTLELKKHIETKFGLKNIEDFKFEWGRVRFNFRPSNFNFTAKE